MSHPEQLTSETHVTNSIRVPHNMELKTVTGTGAMAQKEHGSYFHSTQVQFPAPIPGGSQLPLWLQGTQHLWPSCMLVLICSFPHTEAHTDMKLEKKKKGLSLLS